MFTISGFECWFKKKKRFLNPLILGYINFFVYILLFLLKS